ncbi:putative bifunctional chitinase/lysozyme [Mycobacterium pseudokansasii]|uniref:Putative bifunctional chitinase/lysozyme n=1 Tax=Mycobacterium pseudokansasii TaxID=2341080 RepID=A0A498QXC4_9MYCO|nr:putative bifunctional chitinase/lysozyme [Mycobacterium pseudokansasii]
MLLVAVCVVVVTPVARAAGVTAKLAVTSQWSTGFVANYTISNSDATALSDWKVEFDLPAGESITNAWSTKLAQSGTHYTLTPEDWTRTIAPGSSVTVGFQAAQTGTYSPPANCLVNGQPCSGAGATTTTSALPSTTTTTPTTTSTTSTSAATTSSSAATTTAPTGAAAAYTAAFAKTSDWGNGFNGNFTITNPGPTPLNDWKLEFDMPAGQTVTSAWNAKLAAQGTHYVLTPEDWTRTVAANGGTASLGMQGAYAGSFTAPTNCTLNGQACTGSGVTPAPTTITTTPTTTAPTTTTPPVTPSGSTPARFAPYVDMTLYPQFDYASATRAGGLRHVTLGFIVSGAPCTASWGTYYGLKDQWVTSAIGALTAGGADAIVSFGGVANQELALTCTSVDALVAQYKSVIDAYGIRDLDFDIEGAAQNDVASLTRRSQAIAKLQADGKAAGNPVRVSFTLPVLPTGLTVDGLRVVQNAIANGVDIGQVNVMAMDYYDPAFDYNGKMGDLAIQAAQRVHDQLAALYPSKSDAQLWAMVGVTPMIGVNDDPREVFTVADADKLTAFARQKGLGRLAMWSANRDSQCPAGTPQPSNTCSGVTQTAWAFSSSLKQFGG